jgi:hypothetical protein
VGLTFALEIHAVLIEAHQELVVKEWAEPWAALKDAVEVMEGVRYALKVGMKGA